MWLQAAHPIKVYWGGACLERPRMRMSQMAASVESRGMNLMQSLLFLKACSSVGCGRQMYTGSLQTLTSVNATHVLGDVISDFHLDLTTYECQRSPGLGWSPQAACLLYLSASCPQVRCLNGSVGGGNMIGRGEILIEESMTWQCHVHSYFTYIFFREDPGEAEVAGNLGFEKAIFPQVSIQAICCCTDLEAENVRESRQRQIEYLAVTAGCFLWMKRFGVEAMGHSKGGTLWNNML